MENLTFKDKIMKAWLSCWLYVISAIGASLATLVAVNFKVWETTTTLAVCVAITLVLHVLEEWKFPGGFFYAYNLMMKSDEKMLDRYPMSQVTDMLTNFGALVYCLIMLAIGMPYIAAISAFWFSIMEVIVHTVNGFSVKKHYKAKGKKTIYNPGLATSLFGFLPLAILYVVTFTSQAPTWKELGLSFLLCAGVGVLCIPVAEGIFKNKNTKFPYNWGKGYFEKFEK
ncbi:MAG: HXXEE domain-containing protein [Clostridia bacterium]